MIGNVSCEVIIKSKYAQFRWVARRDYLTNRDPGSNHPALNIPAKTVMPVNKVIYEIKQAACAKFICRLLTNLHF